LRWRHDVDRGAGLSFTLDELPSALADAGVPALDPAALAGVRDFWAWLEDANSRTNLTRIQGEADFAERHVLDALLPLALLDELAARSSGGTERAPRLYDVGSGCGVPGVPLAIARPWEVTLVETASRKARCLAELEPRFAGRLAVISERSELVGRDPAHRDRGDMAVARAVGTVPLVLELTLPLVRPGGAVLLYRGPLDPSERDQAESVGAQLGGGEVSQHAAQLPSGAERSFLIVRKEEPTPERYPRRPGIPGKRPLK
jgi:16S rRNA (guanine527-N7)-methyltransferase